MECGDNKGSLLGKRKRKQGPWLVVLPRRRSSSSDLRVKSFDGLSSWLNGNCKESFMKEHFRKHCVVVKGGGRSATRLVPKRIERLCEETSSDSIKLWLRNKNKLESVETSEGSTAARLYKAGLVALYCRAPERTEEVLVSTMLRDTGLGLPPAASSLSEEDGHQYAGWGEVECFLAGKDHITDFHYDFQENFTLQIRGRKRWILRPSGDRHPIRAKSTHFIDTVGVAEDQAKAASFCNPQCKEYEQQEHSLILEPGDGLYFPAGFQHRVETLDNNSLSINISLMAPTVADLIAGALRHALLASDIARERICSHTDLSTAFRMGQSVLSAISISLDNSATRALIPSAINQSQVDILTDAPPRFDTSLPAFFVTNALATLLPEDAIERQAATRQSKDPVRYCIFCLLHGSTETLQPTLRVKLFLPLALYEFFFFTVLPNAASSLHRSLSSTSELKCIPYRLDDPSVDPTQWTSFCEWLFALGFFLPAPPTSSSN